jgi:hypothetical protein
VDGSANHYRYLFLTSGGSVVLSAPRATVTPGVGEEILRNTAIGSYERGSERCHRTFKGITVRG